MYLNEFEYASKYTFIETDGSVAFMPNTPPEIRERFEKEWAEHVKKVKARQTKGIFTSGDGF
ncbi:MAG: hypothetical protein RRY24_08710 [Clostridiales bacterium]